MELRGVNKNSCFKLVYLIWGLHATNFGMPISYLHYYACFYGNVYLKPEEKYRKYPDDRTITAVVVRIADNDRFVKK